MVLPCRPGFIHHAKGANDDEESIGDYEDFSRTETVNTHGSHPRTYNSVQMCIQKHECRQCEVRGPREPLGI